MPTSPPSGSYSSEQSVTNPAGLIPAMNQFSGTGARLILSAGVVYAAHFSDLNIPTTQFLTIEGNASGDGSASLGPVIDVRSVGGANGSALQYITFRRVTFTAPSLDPTVSNAWLEGMGNQHIMFEDCDFVDFRPIIILNSGDDVRFYRCRITQSPGLPLTTTMNPSILGPGGLLIVKDCYVEWDVQNRYTGKLNIALVGFANYSNNSPGPWWIEDNQILPSGTYSADAAIDIETRTTGDSPFAHCWITRNLIRNSKIWLVTGDDIWITKNTHIIDSNYFPGKVGKEVMETSFIVLSDPRSNPTPLGEVHIEENTILDLTTTFSPLSGTGQPWCARKFNLIRDSYVRALYIHRNQIYYSTIPNGPTMGGVPLGVIDCRNTIHNTNGWGLLSICDNVFGCVYSPIPAPLFVPGLTPLPAIHMQGQASTPWDRVVVRGNRGIGAGPASAILPATIIQGYTYFFDAGGGTGIATVIGDLTIEDNDMGSAISNVAWLNQVGSGNSFARAQWRKNFPREGNDTLSPVASGTPYTHGASPLHTLGTPATGPAYVTVLGGDTGATGGGLTLNGAPLFSGVHLSFNFMMILMIGDILGITFVGTGATAPIVNVIPANSTL